MTVLPGVVTPSCSLDLHFSDSHVEPLFMCFFFLAISCVIVFNVCLICRSGVLFTTPAYRSLSGL